MTENFSICICTFRRVELLQDLLLDLTKQTILPGQLIVVDGDPNSGQAKAMLQSCHYPWKTIYIPSNYANAPYQRYLGSRKADQVSWLIYIDDDIRISQTDFLEKLVAPFCWNNELIVGVSPQINFPNRDKRHKEPGKILVFLNRIFTFGYQTQPGDITPIGDRVFPVSSDEPYVKIKWLHGGVMAYRVEVLNKINELEDAFAMSHIGCGLGVDDTYLSRCALPHGELVLAKCAKAEHPDLGKSNITSEKGYKKGFAHAYSRRFINDHFLPGISPSFRNRMYLFKSYLGNIFLGFIGILKDPSTYKLLYLLGYSTGALKGSLVKPTAINLTPKIDWWKEAEESLSYAVVIQ